MDNLALNSFPYRKDVSGQYFPVIPLVLKYGHKKIDTDALIDSGATFSVFQPAIADYLGIKIDSGKKLVLGGVGGRIKGYLHKLEINVSDKMFTCPIVFSREYLVSFNLLGRKDVFNKFKITFDERKKIVELV
jgi:hypothetical protein